MVGWVVIIVAPLFATTRTPPSTTHTTVLPGLAVSQRRSGLQHAVPHAGKRTAAAATAEATAQVVAAGYDVADAVDPDTGTLAMSEFLRTTLGGAGFVVAVVVVDAAVDVDVDVDVDAVAIAFAFEVTTPDMIALSCLLMGSARRRSNLRRARS